MSGHCSYDATSGCVMDKPGGLDGFCDSNCNYVVKPRCHRTTWGSCEMSIKDPNDSGAYCDRDCNFVSRPPAGCYWNAATSSCHDYGCATAGGFCARNKFGNCFCAK
jgi:hypothetical protein